MTLKNLNYNKIFIYIKNKKHTIIYKKNYNSILDILRKNSFEIDFQCKSGYCGICRVQLIFGNVKYFFKPIAFIKYNEILACCCFPISDIKLVL